MNIKILGTGTSLGVPMIGCQCEVCLSDDSRDNRLRTSVQIVSGESSIMIDIGPDFRQQVLRNGIRDLDAILLTHHHADHTSGMDEIRGFNFTLNRHIPFYAEEYVCRDLRQRFSYIFNDSEYPSLPRIELREIDPFRSFEAAGLEVLPLRVMHGTLPVLGFRIGSFAYITDASAIPEETLQRLGNLEVLVVNALRQRPHHSHFSLQECLEAIGMIGAARTCITHVSHQMGLHREIDRQLPPNVSLAYDGLELHCS